ncbi:hypothetical protein E2C01_027267 [Portunus trituberculatus]|uniref:Uncharacterized protein n=1 Tax=Portunus trituberculatus TaxID=210409 RepID=A0A5B7EL75_PORTR|nr:hypothetical protein [Portunus trituberculatus]
MDGDVVIVQRCLRSCCCVLELFKDRAIVPDLSLGPAQEATRRAGRSLLARLTCCLARYTAGDEAFSSAISGQLRPGCAPRHYFRGAGRRDVPTSPTPPLLRRLLRNLIIAPPFPFSPVQPLTCPIGPSRRLPSSLTPQSAGGQKSGQSSSSDSQSP